MGRHAPIHRRSGHSDIAICCGRNVRGSSPSTSVVPLSNQVTTLNHKRFKGFKMFSDGHLGDDFAGLVTRGDAKIDHRRFARARERYNQPGLEPIDIPETIPNPVVVPKPTPTPTEPAPKEPVRMPEKVPGLTLAASNRPAPPPNAMNSRRLLRRVRRRPDDHRLIARKGPRRPRWAGPQSSPGQIEGAP